MSDVCDICGGEMQKNDDDIWECVDCGEEDTSERISVWDAATIYRSKGCDEDYMFGYSHEELMNN